MCFFVKTAPGFGSLPRKGETELTRLFLDRVGSHGRDFNYKLGRFAAEGGYCIDLHAATSRVENFAEV
jgi:hypothetical protein